MSTSPPAPAPSSGGGLRQPNPEVVAAHIGASASRAAARTGATFALLGSLIGSILGALGAGIPILITSQNQIAAEDARSSSQFLRDERREAYSAFLTNYAAEWRRTIESDYSTSRTIEYYNSANEVRILGSASVAALVDEAESAHSSFAICKADQRPCIDEYDELTRVSEQFISLARIELGAS